MASAIGLRRMILGGRMSKLSPFCAFRQGVFSRARLRWLGLGGGVAGGRTKGGSGEALDFGLETDKVRNLVSGPVGGHGIVCAIDMYVLDGGGDKSGEEPNDLF